MTTKMLVIPKAEVVFFNPVDNGFGTSITIKVDDALKAQIEEFYTTHQIGNDKTGIGKPNFKEYEGTLQYSVKFNDKTMFTGVNGLGKGSIGYGSIVGLALNAFEYNNQFTRGKTYTGISLSTCIVQSESKSATAEEGLHQLQQALMLLPDANAPIGDIPF